MPRGCPAVFLSWLWLSCNGCVLEETRFSFRSCSQAQRRVFECADALCLNYPNKRGIQAVSASVRHEMSEQVAPGQCQVTDHVE